MISFSNELGELVDEECPASPHGPNNFLDGGGVVRKRMVGVGRCVEENGPG